MARALGWLLGRMLTAALVAVLFAVLWALAYRWLNPPITIPMIRDAVAGQHVERTWVPLDRISPAMARAVIGAEDSGFCRHHGFDLAAIEQAAERNAASTKLRGGSTISQQTAKNAFLWPGRSYLRKGLEAYFTVLIEALGANGGSWKSTSTSPSSARECTASRRRRTATSRRPLPG